MRSAQRHRFRHDRAVGNIEGRRLGRFTGDRIVSWIRLFPLFVVVMMLASGCPQTGSNDEDGGQNPGGSGGSGGGGSGGNGAPGGGGGSGGGNGGGGQSDDECTDDRFGFAAVLSGGGTGRMFYRQFPNGCREFLLDVNNVAAGTYSVVLAGTVIDSMTIGPNGSSVLAYSTPGLPFPANFPELAAGDLVSLLGGPSGSLTPECPPQASVCEDGFIRR